MRSLGSVIVGLLWLVIMVLLWLVEVGLLRLIKVRLFCWFIHSGGWRGRFCGRRVGSRRVGEWRRGLVGSGQPLVSRGVLPTVQAVQDVLDRAGHRGVGLWTL